MDLVSRLWYALENEPGILIAYDGISNLEGSFREFFSLAGIQPKQLVQVDIPTCFDEVVVPECTHVPGRYVCPAFARIFDYVADTALQYTSDLPSRRNKRIYLTRRGLQHRFPIELGEASIENLLRTNGFDIISPERFSLSEQISIIRNSQEVACLSGTLPHTMMFAHNGAKLTEFRKSYKPVYRQFSVNQVRSLDATFVDAHISLKPVGASGPFIVTINNNVRRWAADMNYEVPESRFFSSLARKVHVVQYAPLYLTRRNKYFDVPLFIDGEFRTLPNAKRDLTRSYLHRL